MTVHAIRMRLAGLALAVGTLVLVAACSSTAATAAPATSAAPAASAAPGASVALSSAALPGATLPSEDKDLEALLPTVLCGQPAIKTSLSGATFAAAATPVFTAMLSQLGKTPADVSLAFASADPTKAPTCGITVGVFQINGANADALKTVFLAASLQDETTYSESSLGGKDVFLDTSNTSAKSYAYFKGSGVFFLEAPDEATATTILAQMP